MRHDGVGDRPKEHAASRRRSLARSGAKTLRQILANAVMAAVMAAQVAKIERIAVIVFMSASPLFL